MIYVSIAEDLPEIRSALERLITEQKDMVLASSSSNGDEAAPAIINAQPDVVKMDINMPGISFHSSILASQSLHRLPQWHLRFQL